MLVVLAVRGRDVDDVGLVRDELGVRAVGARRAQPVGQRLRPAQIAGADGHDLVGRAGLDVAAHRGRDAAGSEDGPTQRAFAERLAHGAAPAVR